MKSAKIIALFLLLGAFSLNVSFAETVWLDTLNVSAALQGWGSPHANQSVEGHALTIGGQHFQRGFGTHAESTLYIQLNEEASNFVADVGVDDDVSNSPNASVEFFVVGDGKTLWQSGVMRAGDVPKHCEVDLAHVKTLLLRVGDGGNGIDHDHADWADAKIETKGAKTFAVGGQELLDPIAPYILTPPAPASPRINGARVMGVRPGSPFLFIIAATGDRPLRFSAKGLPAGLKLDAETGRITGKLKTNGEYTVVLRAKNARGKADSKFRIVCGDQIALTPPMGWNSWNCFAGNVSEEKVKSAADAMVKSGLINHGWTYINVDDFWQNQGDSKDPTLRGPYRDAQGFIVANSRFPDMKGMADYIHSLGLRAGLYSSPGPWTCGGCVGSWKHEKEDAETYASWGFDYLKYDWCSYADLAEGRSPEGKNVPHWGQTNDEAVASYPYSLMGRYLREQPRDIVFSLCQYGMADVWKWGGSIGGNCWRTTDDINDRWGRATHGWGNGGAGGGLDVIGFNQDKSAPYAKPGNWNDPDMLIVGQIGWGNPHPSRLNPDEQYTHISLWCLLAAPLLIGCDMTKFDDFTLNLLSNDEVLAVDQDPLGRQATCVIRDGDLRIYEKDLEDGGHALGFFNLGASPLNLNFGDFAALKLTGKIKIRDLWRQQDVAKIEASKGKLPMVIPAHGVMLYKALP
ncbi:MAG TPA: NPCBM/NEW2 domain-containing protein [Verrucomicrobiae bacterium]|jgi:alpha-galactosidase|nr:NPCBM/NEW2 domain-containing protein [Verrucomicrobiae bacterium]